MDSVSDDVLRSGAEILVHAYADGTVPAAERLDVLGVPYQVVPATGVSEDLALLLAYEKGAELIVAVGTHFNLIEFLERDRAGMSSTFLARLASGEILVDAKGVSRLVSRKVGMLPFVALAVTRARRRGGRDRRVAGAAPPDQPARPADRRLFGG